MFFMAVLLNSAIKVYTQSIIVIMTQFIDTNYGFGLWYFEYFS